MTCDHPAAEAELLSWEQSQTLKGDTQSSGGELVLLCHIPERLLLVRPELLGFIRVPGLAPVMKLPISARVNCPFAVRCDLRHTSAKAQRLIRNKR